MDDIKNVRKGITSNVITDRIGRVGYYYIKDAGFNDVDFNLQRGFFLPELLRYRPGIEKIIQEHKATILEAGLQVSQAHAPYYFQDYHITAKENLHKYIEVLKISVEIAEEVGTRYLVVHPMYLTQSMKQWGLSFETVNTECYQEIASYAKKRGVYIAIENLPYDECNSLESHRSIISMINKDNVVACFDTGHAIISEGDQSVRHVVEMRDVIHVIHIHDNAGIIDEHNRVNHITDRWRELIRSFLGNINIKTISLETSGVYKTCDVENIKKEIIVDYRKLENLLNSVVMESAKDSSMQKLGGNNDG